LKYDEFKEAALEFLLSRRRFTVREFIKAVYGRPYFSFKRHAQYGIRRRVAQALKKLEREGVIQQDGAFWRVRRRPGPSDL